MKFPDDQFTDPNLVTRDDRFVLPEGTTAKQALEMVYRGEIVLSPQQMRAAIECLQFEVPKVSAVAHIDGSSLADRLEKELRAIERSKGPLLLNGPPPPELPAEELKGPFPNYRNNLRRF